MNTFFGIGRITKDHELRVTEKGLSVVTFTLAINRDKDNTDFLNCVAFNKTAELLKTYTSKGSQIGIEGMVQTRSYEKDGEKKYSTNIIVNRVEFLDTKKKDDMNIEQGEELPF
jgi:single-strand DNA-binding protein